MYNCFKCFYAYLWTYPLRKNISYGGNVTKSYRVPPKRCNPIGKSPFPQLIASGTDTYADTFYIPFHHGFYFRHGRCGFGYDSLKHIVGYSHGLLFGRGRGYVPSSQLYLWNLWECSIYSWLNPGCNIPPWDTSVPFKHGAISSSPVQGTSPTVMVLTGMNHPAFAFYRLRGGEYAWIKQDCTLVDPHSTNNQLIQFTHAIWIQRKVLCIEFARNSGSDRGNRLSSPNHRFKQKQGCSKCPVDAFQGVLGGIQWGNLVGFPNFV
ncbi:hypothetical protein RHGRI_013929 [Rhododendron griersonianum]|uniref:Uncharacterized protein n=1 Tax=Rhododendron griersonianum TaxID=479676 RepID=A0AAV6K7Y2_9ERIC|nr:hypothetical protein RHGRI_013929 [Rhododendron griersonianum]